MRKIIQVVPSNIPMRADPVQGAVGIELYAVTVDGFAWALTRQGDKVQWVQYPAIPALPPSNIPRPATTENR